MFQINGRLILSFIRNGPNIIVIICHAVYVPLLMMHCGLYTDSYVLNYVIHTTIISTLVIQAYDIILLKS